MNTVVDRARRLAPSRLPLVLTGPSGVGKTAFARAIHEASGRSGAFEVVDVPSVAGPLFAAEVFGAAAGAWTDGRRERVGAVVRADRGTLFLDEIAECPMPSLRRRPGDVVLIARDWLATHAPGARLSAAAWAALTARAWPGEVREVLHVLERAVALAGGQVVEVADLEDPSDPVRAVARSAGVAEGQVALRFAGEMRRAWARAGSQRAAARELGWSWSTWRTRRDAWGVGGPPTAREEGS